MKLLILFGFSTIFLYSEVITPIPSSIFYNINKVMLGKKMFFDKRLSKNNNISCATCHDLSKMGMDNKKLSVGTNGDKNINNTPSIYNTIYNSSQMWNGSVNTLKEQISTIIKNPTIMNSKFKNIVDKLKQDMSLVKEFQTVYKNGISKENIIDAIFEFEKVLITPNSKFDKYLNGNLDILNDDEKDGYKLFKSYGCISCHNGINIGGNLSQKLGIINLLNSNIKNKNNDKKFKVPSLRNVELTYPYMHDGTIKNLDKTVSEMFIQQVGYIPEDKEIKNIVKFLKTLTGKKLKY